MIPTAESILADLIADMTAFEASTERAQQVETGASQLYGCLAETMFRLRGETPESRPSWDLIVGKAVHEYLATARSKVDPEAVVETRFVWRGVPATVDYLKGPLLVDYKTDKDGEDIVGLDEAGKPKWLAQVHVGAMGARDAGYPVEYVAVIVLPRSGSMEEARVLGPWEVDEELAAEAVTWAADAEIAAASDADPRDFRGMPAFFCHAYCPFVAPCRGEEAPNPDLAELEPVAARYHEAGITEKQAAQLRKDLRPLLMGVNDVVGGFRVSTSGGRSSDAEDVDRMRDLWRFTYGEEPPRKPSTTAVQLRVTPVRAKGEK